MTTEQRIESVERFGYSTREASFLVLAALHSGYFLRRQYCAHLGVGFGYPNDVLTSKLLRLGHAREVSLRYGRRLYRIHSKPIYAALEEVDNRNRRVHLQVCPEVLEHGSILSTSWRLAGKAVATKRGERTGRTASYYRKEAVEQPWGPYS
jgi:hypothetical protein